MACVGTLTKNGSFTTLTLQLFQSLGPITLNHLVPALKQLVLRQSVLLSSLRFSVPLHPRSNRKKQVESIYSALQKISHMKSNPALPINDEGILIQNFCKSLSHFCLTDVLLTLVTLAQILTFETISWFSDLIDELDQSHQEHPCSLHAQHTKGYSKTVPILWLFQLLLLPPANNSHYQIRSYSSILKKFPSQQ